MDPNYSPRNPKQFPCRYTDRIVACMDGGGPCAPSLRVVPAQVAERDPPRERAPIPNILVLHPRVAMPFLCYRRDPCDPSDLPPPAAANGHEPHSDPHRRRSTAIVARDLERRLRALGYATLGPAHDAQEALRFAGEIPPDLVLMDIHLPGGTDGIHAAMILREQHRIPVVFLTAGPEGSHRPAGQDRRTLRLHRETIRGGGISAAVEVALHEHSRGLESRMRDSEEIHRTILDTTLDGYFLADPSGRFLEVDEAYATMLGYTRTELLQLSLAELEYPGLAVATADLLRDTLVIGSARFQRRHRRKDDYILTMST